MVAKKCNTIIDIIVITFESSRTVVAKEIHTTITSVTLKR